MDVILRKVQDKIQQSLRRRNGGAKYFSGARRGDSAELHDDLNSNDLSRQKNAVKRIIANMTLGRDVSCMFADVVKLGQTSNLELKKLVYLYVLNTAKLQPDKAFMAVNTFIQDATSPSPVVRALAVRTMLCIRVDSVLEYTLEPLRRAVIDPHPYVRKTAAIGLGKIYHHNKEFFHAQDFSTEVQKLLRDRMSVVSSNAAAIWCEINAFDTKTLICTDDSANRFLFHLQDCTEWGQCYILELLSSLKPKNEESAEAMVQRVIPRLSHANPAVVMATIKIIATFANRCPPDSIGGYVARINSALLSLARTDPETQYVVCKNIHALLITFPDLLRDDLNAFYVRFTDPPYVKLEKLKLLLKLVTPATAVSVVKELREYCTEVDPVFVEEVTRSIAALAVKVEVVAPECADLLMSLVERRPEVMPHVLTAAKTIARKYPDLLLLEPLLTKFGADAVVEEEAKVSLLWMLGEYCEFIENGPDVIQQFIDTLMSQEDEVQLAILSATIKMFLRSPSAMEQTLNHVLDTLTSRSKNPDVRDRAVAYWRLLSRGLGVTKMKEIVHGLQVPVNVDRTFSDAMTVTDLKRAINTAAVVFGKPYLSFLPPYGLSERTIEDDEDEEEGEERFGTEAAGVCASGNEADGGSLAAVSGGGGGGDPPQTAARIQYADPLGDLFDAPSVKAAAPSVRDASWPVSLSQVAATADGLDPLFSQVPQMVHFKVPPSLSASLVTGSLPPAGPVPPKVLDPSTTGGVTVYCECVNGAMLSITFTNDRASPVAQLELQINTSALGFTPSVPLASVLPAVPPGATMRAQLPLTAVVEHCSPARVALEVGLRMNEAGPFLFTVPVPKTMYFQPPQHKLDRGSFGVLLGMVASGPTVKQGLNDMGHRLLMLGEATVCAELEGAHVSVVEATDTPEQLLFSCCVLTTVGATVPFQVVLQRGNPHLSYMQVWHQQASIVSAILSHLLTEVLTSVPEARVPSRPAGDPPRNTLEDLFA